MDEEHRSRAADLPVREVSPADDQARAAVAAYVEELNHRFVEVFHTGATSPAEEAADVASMTRPEGVFLVVSDGAEPVSCGGLRRLDPDTLEIKRMWVREDWRGSGLARRLVAHLEAVALELGGRRVVLDTSRTLTEAMALYARLGYHEIERYNDNPYAEAWFEKPLPPG